MLGMRKNLCQSQGRIQRLSWGRKIGERSEDPLGSQRVQGSTLVGGGEAPQELLRFGDTISRLKTCKICCNKTIFYVFCLIPQVSTVLYVPMISQF